MHSQINGLVIGEPPVRWLLPLWIVACSGAAPEPDPTLPALALGQPTTVEETDKNFSESGAEDAWIYNDLDKGIAEARAAKKPLMVVYRCIP